jgi:hypothetical protein
MEIIHTGITLSLVAYRNLLRENVKYRSSMLLVQVRRVLLAGVTGAGVTWVWPLLALCCNLMPGC